MASIDPVSLNAPLATAVTITETALLLAENTQLKQQVASLQQENEDLKRDLRKRRAGASSSPAAKKTRTPAHRKKLFEKWAKAACRESAECRLSHVDALKMYTVTVKESTPWTDADFESVFRGQGGTQIQPTRENKPTSPTTILRFESLQDIQRLFDDVHITEQGYQVQAWKSLHFGKNERCGVYPALLRSLDVQYNKSKYLLQLHFQFQAGEGYE